jgi:hypothetical protein
LNGGPVAASIHATPRGKGYDTLAKEPADDASQQHHEGANSGPPFVITR